MLINDCYRLVTSGAFPEDSLVILSTGTSCPANHTYLKTFPSRRRLSRGFTKNKYHTCISIILIVWKLVDSDIPLYIQLYKKKKKTTLITPSRNIPLKMRGWNHVVSWATGVCLLTNSHPPVPGRGRGVARVRAQFGVSPVRSLFKRPADPSVHSVDLLHLKS